MKNLIAYAFQGGGNILATVATSITFLAGLIQACTNMFQLGTDNGGWQMIIFAGFFVIGIYFVVFGPKSWITYVCVIPLIILTCLYFWLAFCPGFLLSVGILYWGMTYNAYQNSLTIPPTPPTT